MLLLVYVCLVVFLYWEQNKQMKLSKPNKDKKEWIVLIAVLVKINKHANKASLLVCFVCILVCVFRGILHLEIRLHALFILLVLFAIKKQALILASMSILYQAGTCTYYSAPIDHTWTLLSWGGRGIWQALFTVKPGEPRPGHNGNLCQGRLVNFKLHDLP